MNVCLANVNVTSETVSEVLLMNGTWKLSYPDSLQDLKTGQTFNTDSAVPIVGANGALYVQSFNWEKGSKTHLLLNTRGESIIPPTESLHEKGSPSPLLPLNISEDHQELYFVQRQQNQSIDFDGWQIYDPNLKPLQKLKYRNPLHSRDSFGQLFIANRTVYGIGGERGEVFDLSTGTPNTVATTIGNPTTVVSGYGLVATAKPSKGVHIFSLFDKRTDVRVGPIESGTWSDMDCNRTIRLLRLVDENTLEIVTNSFSQKKLIVTRVTFSPKIPEAER